MEKTDISILFSDIKGYTSIMKEVESSLIKHLLNEYLKEMTRLVVRYRGTIDKIMGDGIMAIFGAPIPQTDHALRAVMTALKMQQKIEFLRPEWQKMGRNSDLQVRIGISTGKVFVGELNLKDHIEYTAVGDEVNLASRLQDKAPPGKILVSIETFDQVNSDFDFERIDNLELKGFSDSQTAYLVKTEKDIKAINKPSNKTSQQTADDRKSSRRNLILDIVYEINGKLQNSKSINVSEHGIYIQTDVPESIGSKITIWSNIPTDRGILPIGLKGKVVRKGAEKESMGMGIEFYSIAADNSDTICHFVKEVYGLQITKKNITQKDSQYVFILDKKDSTLTLFGQKLLVKYLDLGDGEPEYLSKRIVHEFDRTKRYGNEFSCVALSIINLNSISNLQTCIDILKTVFEILKNALRTTDEVFYLNEATFFILAPETMSNRASTLTKRLVERIDIKFKQMNFDNKSISIKAGFFSFDGENASSPVDIFNYTLSVLGK